MGKDHNYTSVLTLPESLVERAVRKYVEAGHAGADFRSCPIMGVRFGRCGPDSKQELLAHITIQTGGF